MNDLSTILFRVVTFPFSEFLYSCMRYVFSYAQPISVCANTKRSYFHSNGIELMEDPHHTHSSFMNQEQKHRYIQYNNLTHMTTLATWYLFQECHTCWKMQYLWHVDELILHQLINHHYIRIQYYLYSIVQLIPFLINSHYSLYISVAAYSNY